MARPRVTLSLALLLLTIALAAPFAVSRPQAAEPAADEKQTSEQAKAAAREQFLMALEEDVTQGALRFQGDKGQVVECPLKHTDVKAEISGFIARVNVTQTFHNPTKEKIEAIYVFPLPHESAVDNMTMVIGDRKVVGIIQRREEARRIYEEAIAQGQTAALLEQERPNIFTQTVGNIAPGQEVKIEISYVDTLRYDMGTYEFSFPMVVGPRYIPGSPLASPQPNPAELQGKVSPPVADTNRVPDASRISPPVLKPGVRNGHDISLSVSLDAGVPVQNLTVPNHQSDVKRDGDSRATIALSPADSLPNKDFVLRYDVVGEKPALAVLSHTGKYSPDAAKLGEGYVMLMIQPKEDERLQKSPPREIVFLCDVSGSMSGQPTAKVIETMQHMLKLCREDKDTVQVITFAGEANKLFEKPVPVNKENIAKALSFSQGFQGSGGTEMLKGVQMAIDEPVDKERVRIVVMLTDGYIGNEAEIIEHVGKNCGDRVRFWCVGIGSSPNMFLVDGVAKQGGGMGKQLSLEDDALSLSQDVMARIQRAQLANVKIDWGDLKVSETYPAKIPELWAGRPIIVYGRYQGGGSSTISIHGDIESEAATWPLEVKLAEKEPQHDVLAKVWARQKIEDLMQQDYYQNSPAVEETVTALALDYKLMSQYTSFVAVDAQSATSSDGARPPRKMLVPVPLPEGTRWEGFFGEMDRLEDLAEREVQLRGGEVSKRAGFAGRGFLPMQQQAQGRFLTRNPSRMRSLALSPSPAASTSAGLSALGKAPAVNRLSAASGPIAAGGAAPMARDGSDAPGLGYRMNYFYAQGGLGGAPGGGFGGGGFGGQFGNGWGRADGGRAAAFGLQPLKQLSESLARVEAKSEDSTPVDYAYTGAAIAAADVTPLAQEAAKALEEGRSLQKDGKLPEAREALLKAYFLDAAAANFGGSGGETAQAALAGVEAIRHAQIDKWTKDLPQLDKRLDVVIRDKPLAEALETIANAAGVDVRVVRGSLADVAELLNQEELRVSYLDLRGATLTQALDWALQPVRLDWTIADGAVSVQSTRREAGVSAWVYDVSLTALPSPEEINREQDEQKRVEAAKQHAEAFLQAVRAELPGEAVRAGWFGPGQLLVIGPTNAHERAATLLALLADAKAEGRLGKSAAELRTKTAQRAKDRKEAVAKAREVSRRLDVAIAHEQFAWQLLAAAADGRLDLEALTELQIAWSRPETAKLLEAKAPGVLVRSWWAVTESARALPKEKELQSLAAKASDMAQGAAEQALKSLKENPADADAALTVLYAALAGKSDGYRRQAAAALQAASGDDASLAAIRTLSAALLAEDATKIDGASLVDVLQASAQGDDLVALAALACRRAGGDAWDAFRRQQRDLIGRQPLTGDVVVLVNRLSAAWLPLVAQAR